MKIVISSLLILLMSQFAFAENFELPQYSEENRIPADQVSLYREALQIDLNNRGYDRNCDTNSGGHSWRVPGLLSGRASGSWYLFPGDQPLIIVRFNGYTGVKDVDVIDFQFLTNESLTTIVDVNVIEYSVVSTRVNIGTILEPKIIDRTIVSKVFEGPCYKDLK